MRRRLFLRTGSASAAGLALAAHGDKVSWNMGSAGRGFEEPESVPPGGVGSGGTG